MAKEQNKHKEGDVFYYGGTNVTVRKVVYNEKLGMWFYEVENRNNGFKAMVKESELKKL